MIKLVVGLGNPGFFYKQTRHNFGFDVVDSWAKNVSFKKRFHGLFGISDVALLKPQTLMNLSGISVLSCCRFYKFRTNDILVIHDDIELELGIIKVKKGGGHAGHNGIQNIDNAIGRDYWRMRLGIGRPPKHLSVSDFVLSRFSNHELLIKNDVINFIDQRKDSFINKIDRCTYRLNQENL